jgi:hypothetical protein
VIPGVARTWNRADQDSEAQMGMHHQSGWGLRSEQEPRDEVHILGKNSEPFWPFLDGLTIVSAIARIIIFPTTPSMNSWWITWAICTWKTI